MEVDTRRKCNCGAQLAVNELLSGRPTIPRGGWEREADCSCAAREIVSHDHAAETGVADRRFKFGIVSQALFCSVLNLARWHNCSNPIARTAHDFTVLLANQNRDG